VIFQDTKDYSSIIPYDVMKNAFDIDFDCNYIGDMSEGKPHGEGIYTCKNKDHWM